MRQLAAIWLIDGVAFSKRGMDGERSGTPAEAREILQLKGGDKVNF